MGVKITPREKRRHAAGREKNEVYERVGISVISICKKAQKGLQMHFFAVQN